MITIGFDAKRLFHNNTGLGNYSRDLTTLLINQFPQNNYFLFNPKPKSNARFQVSKADYEEINPTGFWKKLTGFWRTFGITKTSAFKQLDIYHGLSGEIPYGISNNIKTVVTIHDLIFLRYPHLYHWLDVRIHQIKFKYACQNAHMIVAISEQTKQDIINYFGIDSQKIKVIYQGCSSVFKEKFSDDEKQLVIEKFNLPPNFLLNVGTIEPRKNIFEVVKALKGSNIPLIIIGKKTKYFKTIQTYLEAHQMQNQVRVLKDVSMKELAIIYQLATIFVYPSVFEGFGIPVIEALYSGTPVITNGSGVFPEAAGPHSAYVNVEDSQDIKNKILSLWHNDAMRASMREKGLEYVQKFNDTTLANQWQSLYNKLLNEGSGF